MKNKQEIRAEIIDHLEAMRADRHSYDTLQLARYIETGQIDDGEALPETDEDAEFKVEKIDPSKIQFLKGAKFVGPFKLDKPKDERPGQIWCDNCKEWHQLPEDAEVAEAVAEFFKQFAPKEATDPDASPATPIPGRDA